jgi:hypothetical protein
VFLRELAGKRAVAFIAKFFYGERFRHVSLACRMEGGVDGQPPHNMEFRWRDHGSNFRLAACVDGPAGAPEPDSLDEFVVDHYFAYTAGRRGESTEYQVAHIPWMTAHADAEFFGDAYRQYGARFAPYLRGEPMNAFWASGSPVRVYRGQRLEAVVRRL